MIKPQQRSFSLRSKHKTNNTKLKHETYNLSLWSNVEYTAERTTATRFGRTLGCGQAAPGL